MKIEGCACRINTSKYREPKTGPAVTTVLLHPSLVQLRKRRGEYRFTKEDIHRSIKRGARMWSKVSNARFRFVTTGESHVQVMVVADNPWTAWGYQAGTQLRISRKRWKLDPYVGDDRGSKADRMWLLARLFAHEWLHWARNDAAHATGGTSLMNINLPNVRLPSAEDKAMLRGAGYVTR